MKNPPDPDEIADFDAARCCAEAASSMSDDSSSKDDTSATQASKDEIFR